MRWFAAFLFCIVLVLASIGPVAAQDGRSLFLPLVAVDAPPPSIDWELEDLIDTRAAVFGYDAGLETHVLIGTFSLSCMDPQSLASSENVLRDLSSAYGSPTGIFSAMNPESDSPPIVALPDGSEWDEVAWLTGNPDLSPRLDSERILNYLAERAGCEWR